MPAVVTINSEGGAFRKLYHASMMKVKKKEIPKWSASDVGFEKSDIMEMKDLYEPDLGITDCDLMPGESPEEQGKNLAKRLLEEGLSLK